MYMLILVDELMMVSGSTHWLIMVKNSFWWFNTLAVWLIHSLAMAASDQLG